MAKEIQLTQGKVALVDNEDFEYLNQWKWCLGGGSYAMRSSMKSDNLQKRKTILLHTLLIKKTGKMEIDHINGNRLDNRKSNLRLVTRNVNQMNKVKTISFDIQRKKWRISLRYGNNKRLFKRYKTYQEALDNLIKYTKELQGIEPRLC